MTIFAKAQDSPPHYPALSRAKMALCVLLALLASAAVPLRGVERVPSLPHKDAIPETAGREITDPCLGFHWRLIVDSARPGRPGRMVLFDPRDRENNPDRNSHEGRSARSGAAHLAAHEIDRLGAAQPLIRAGAHVIVLQETSAVRARLYAVALDSAGLGQRLRVRLVLAPALGRNAELTSLGMIVSVLATGTSETSWTDSESAVLPERGN